MSWFVTDNLDLFFGATIADAYFQTMTLSKNYVMKLGDTSRTIQVVLKENNGAPVTAPSAAKLRVKIGSGVVEKDLTQSGAYWQYHVTAEDFTAWGIGTIKAEIKATIGTETLTYPTKGFLAITILPTLDEDGNLPTGTPAIQWDVTADMAALIAIHGTPLNKVRMVTDPAAPHTFWYYVHGDDAANADGVNVVRATDNLGNWYALSRS